MVQMVHICIWTFLGNGGRAYVGGMFANIEIFANSKKKCKIFHQKGSCIS